jgi:hypothetical protein
MTFSENVVTQILQTVNAQEAICGGFGRNLGETVRIKKDNGGGEILTYSGLRFKRID